VDDFREARIRHADVLCKCGLRDLQWLKELAQENLAWRRGPTVSRDRKSTIHGCLGLGSGLSLTLRQAQRDNAFARDAGFARDALLT
jgi:hypothetical protein